MVWKFLENIHSKHWILSNRENEEQELFWSSTCLKKGLQKYFTTKAKKTQNYTRLFRVKETRV